MNKEQLATDISNALPKGTDGQTTQQVVELLAEAIYKFVTEQINLSKS